MVRLIFVSNSFYALKKMSWAWSAFYFFPDECSFAHEIHSTTDWFREIDG